MKRPTQVQVGAFLYNVIYSNEEIKLRSADQGRKLVGYVNHHILTITVDDAIDEQVIRDTLLHEVVHCLWHDAGIGGSDMTEEDIVGSLTPRLLLLLMNNPGLVRYLLGGYDDEEAS